MTGAAVIGDCWGEVTADEVRVSAERDVGDAVAADAAPIKRAAIVNTVVTHLTRLAA